MATTTSPLPAPSAPGSATSSPSPPPSSSPSTSQHQAVSVPNDPRNPTLFEGARSIAPQDLMHVHQLPCARQALMFGLGAGFGVGGLHFILRTTTRRGRPDMTAAAWRSMNWFVGSWALGSVGAFKFCQRQRELERKAIGRAKELMEKKRREKEEEMKRARDSIRRRREEEDRLERERKNKWLGLGRWLAPAPELSNDTAKKQEGGVARSATAADAASTNTKETGKDSKPEGDAVRSPLESSSSREAVR